VQVLCIDNEASILSGMEALLSQWGCNVWTARDLAEATSQLQNEDCMPHVILVDYHLDKTTGVEVFQSLATICTGRPTGILITADRSEHQTRPCLAQQTPETGCSTRAAFTQQHDW